MPTQKQFINPSLLGRHLRHRGCSRRFAVESLECRRLLAADVFEPNDTPEEAFDLFTGDLVSTNLNLHVLGDVDYYSWRSPGSGTLNVDVLFAHAAGNIDLAVYNSRLQLLASSTSTTDNEHVVLNVASDQLLYFEVFGIGRLANDNYSLKIDGPLDIPADRLEPNENASSATALGVGDAIVADLTVHRTGEFASSADWFSWTAANTGPVTIELDFVHALGNLDLRLWDARQNVLRISNSMTDGESIAYEVQRDATYFVEVYGYVGAGNPHYNLGIDGPEAPREADLVATLFSESDLITPGERLTYELVARNIGPRDTEVLVSHSLSTGLLGGEYISVSDGGAQGNSQGRFVDGLEEMVSMPAGSQVVYTITGLVDFNAVGEIVGEASIADLLQLTDPNSENNHTEIRFTLLDGMEPNDYRESAVRLGTGPQNRTGLGLHNAEDQDWYTWTSLADGISSVRVAGLRESDRFNVVVYDAEGKIVAASREPMTDVIVEWESTAEEDYSVEVYSQLVVARAPYDLFFEAPGDIENYAVLFAGGINADNNHKRYYDNVRDLYETLVDDLGVEDDHIFVLYADGINPAVDRSDGFNSNMSYATNVESATPANLESTLQALADEIDSNDHFLFWSFDHGGGTHHFPGYSGYSASAPTITGEEVLSGWGGSVSDEDLADWLNGISAGHTTLVYTQCFAGGMLDNILPLTSSTYGMAATNHYEFSWGDGFAAAFNDALEHGNVNSNDAYIYAHDHDSYAATRGTYVANAGTVANSLEHPWAANTSNFPIMYQESRVLPHIDLMYELPWWRRLPPEPWIPFEWLDAAATSSYADGGSTRYRVESVVAGRLLLNDEPVVPGESVIGPGDRLLWTPPTASTSETLTAFWIRAYNGSAVSTAKIPVRLQLSDPTSEVVAVDDSFQVLEDSQRVQLPVLRNDLGEIDVIGVSAAHFGTVQLIQGEVYYNPPTNWVGTDLFTYQVSTELGEMDAATVELIVEPTNDAPIAALDTVVLAAGASRVAIDVVRNDFDQDGDALLALLSKGPAHGTLMTPTSAITPSPWRYGGIPDPSGLFYYTPDAGFVGTDQFTYHVTDGLAQSEAVEVTLHVSRATPGDANLDRRVDTEDFWLWLENNFQAGTDWEQANFNGDGVTDVSDFNIWFAHRFTETGEAESAVPRVPRAAAMFAVNLPVPLDGATRLARPSLPLPYEPLNGLSSTVSRRADEALASNAMWSTRLERVAWVRTAERATTNATDTIFAELGSVLLPTWDGNVLVN